MRFFVTHDNPSDISGEVLGIKGIESIDSSQRDKE